MDPFPATISRPAKRSGGRTDVFDTPLAIRGRISLAGNGHERIRAKLGRAFASLATRIERVSVRFVDVNGPRGGVDTICRMKVVLSGADSVLVEQRAKTPEQAVSLALPRLVRAVRRGVSRRGGKAPGPRRAGPSGQRARPASAPDPGSFIGRRVGRAKVNLDRALERPEKLRRDAYVDTAAVGVSASDRRAGGASSARRNTKGSSAGMTATLEDSRKKPSRKSSRRSTNRARSGTPLTTRALQEATTPQARHIRGRK
jgi:hypothetical protein